MTFYHVSQGVATAYFRIKLTTVVIASDSFGGSECNATLDIENVSLHFGEISIADLSKSSGACYNSETSTSC